MNFLLGSSPRRYLFVLFVGLAVALLSLTATRLLVSGDAMSRCDPGNFDGSNYVSYCHASNFGDYDHGALYFALEPDAIANLKRADILVLGNSRIMFAASNQNVRDFFKKLGAREYLLGFGYGQQMQFPRALIRKFDLRPKAIIINADPFFSEHVAPQFVRLMQGDGEVFLSYVFKKYFQRWQRRWCGDAGGASQRWFCGSVPAIFRSTADGHWQLDRFLKAWPHADESKPIIIKPDNGMEKLGETLALARNFRQQLALPASCILITVTPAEEATVNLAKTVAKEIGAQFLATSFENYHSFDGSHLTAYDAKRWSMEMLEAARPFLTQCLEGATSSLSK